MCVLLSWLGMFNRLFTWSFIFFWYSARLYFSSHSKHDRTPLQPQKFERSIMSWLSSMKIGTSIHPTLVKLRIYSVEEGRTSPVWSSNVLSFQTLKRRWLTPLPQWSRAESSLPMLQFVKLPSTSEEWGTNACVWIVIVICSSQLSLCRRKLRYWFFILRKEKVNANL